ncbi:hypothetical protein G7085_15165 [Tessaracoccus sp. HDW20]|uniref:hypothetical protein n=1 Tax=Tessaracoccus coleopterorum TaxID=2714950 RepID=UPI0018D2ED5C|nr:hypothetical protein [Tessaracoccus coleopterorum]NHB85500.1 hypothetical protein [Tessaracoccus coleopterorum]
MALITWVSRESDVAPQPTEVRSGRTAKAPTATQTAARRTPARVFSAFIIGASKRPAGSPALHEALDAFWANAPGPGGIGLQDRFAAMWAHVAARVAGHPALLGYDLLNEPAPGRPHPASSRRSSAHSPSPQARTRSRCSPTSPIPRRSSPSSPASRTRPSTGSSATPSNLSCGPSRLMRWLP